MSNALTYRHHRRILELSLWNDAAGPITSTIGCILFAVTALYAFTISDKMQLGRDSWPLLGMGLLLLVAWSAWLRFLLWHHFGREVIELRSGECRIAHDFRMWRRDVIERPYRFIDASYWTNADDGDRSGWLVLTCDDDVLQSRVPLPVEDLDRAVALVRGLSSKRRIAPVR